MPADQGRQPADAVPASILSGEHARDGRESGRRLHRQILENAAARTERLHQRGVHFRRLRVQGPRYGRGDRTRERPARHAASGHGNTRRRSVVPRLAQPAVEMDVLAGAFLARGSHARGAQQPFRHDARDARVHRRRDPPLPHPAGTRRRRPLRPRHVQPLHLVRPHRRRIAGRQGARPRVHEQHAAKAPFLRPLRRGQGAAAAHGRHRNGLFRRVHPRQRTAIRHQRRRHRRGNPVGVRQFAAARNAGRRPAGLYTPRREAVGRPVELETRGFALSAVRGYLFDLHDPAHRQRGPDAAAAGQGDQERLRLGLFRVEPGLHPRVGQPAQRGKDGHRHPRGLRIGGRRLLFPDHFGRRPFAELLPDRRREA